MELIRRSDCGCGWACAGWKCSNKSRAAMFMFWMMLVLQSRCFYLVNWAFFNLICWFIRVHGGAVRPWVSVLQCKDSCQRLVFTSDRIQNTVFDENHNINRFCNVHENAFPMWFFYCFCHLSCLQGQFVSIDATQSRLPKSPLLLTWDVSDDPLPCVAVQLMSN